MPTLAPTMPDATLTQPGDAALSPEQQAAVGEQLRAHFGFDGLRPGQAAALAPVLHGRDTLVVMPTGAGKSLIYQLAALLQEHGTTVVVSPLIALMKDQVDGLRARGIAAAYVNSSQTQAEQRDILARLRRGELTMIYVAPERLRLPGFQASLREANVTLLAVDEAHCVSQWGHDFRPDYLHIGTARRAMGSPTCVALTATATGSVRDDIAHQLGLDRPRVLVTGFNRPNLRFEVRATPGKREKRRALFEFIRERPGEAGLIYAGTRKDVEELARVVRDETGRPCEAYHAGLPDAERAHVQDSFIQGRLDLVVATNAFGMGVDRGDVRFVAHWALPATLEAYYQEAGRAGRDGDPATAVLFYAPQDRGLREWFIDQQAPSSSDVRGVYEVARRRARGGELRAEQDELADAAGVHPVGARVALSILERGGALDRLGDEGQTRIWAVQPWRDASLRDALRHSDAHRDGKTANLRAIVAYAETDACRRRALLDHFGDAADTDVPADACCDVCRVNARLKDAPDEVPEWDQLPMNARIALGLLDAVRRLAWPVGRLTLSKILSGSRAQGMDRYEQHPYFGRLGTLNQKTVDGLYKELLLRNYLRMVSREAGGNTFQVVELTALGHQALAHREAIDLDVPVLGAAGGRTRSGSGEAVALDAADADLFEQLRAWRSEQAAERGVPPYVVFNDKTLRAIAAARPQTDDDLLAVSGVGPAKLEAYGEDVLDLVDGA